MKLVMRLVLSLAVVAGVCFALFWKAEEPGRRQEPAPVNPTAEAPGAPRQGPPDQALPGAQKELLEVAASAAAALPLNPHVKNRARAQGDVVSCLLRLGQAQWAAEVAETMPTWRQALATAEVAAWYEAQGRPSDARHHLGMAESLLHQASEDDQGWRRDRVRASIAQVWLRLGEEPRARSFMDGLSEEALGAVAQDMLLSVSEEDLTGRVKVLKQILETGSLDQKKAALLACVAIHGARLHQEVWRAQMEEMVCRADREVPVPIRVEMLTKLARNLLNGGHAKDALSVLTEAEALLDARPWLLEDAMRLNAPVAALRGECGDRGGAETRLDALFLRYEREGHSIADVFRGAALRPLAEAYATVGNVGAAQVAYLAALDAGALNPNARPRAEDLVATCCSMAERGIDPTEAGWEKIRKTHSGLTTPW